MYLVEPRQKLVEGRRRFFRKASAVACMALSLLDAVDENRDQFDNEFQVQMYACVAIIRL